MPLLGDNTQIPHVRGNVETRDFPSLDFTVTNQNTVSAGRLLAATESGITVYHVFLIRKEHVRRERVPAVRVAAFPQPFSSFSWRVIVETEDYYDIAYVNLAGGYAMPAKDTGIWNKVRATYSARTRMNWERQRRYGDPGPLAFRVEML